MTLFLVNTNHLSEGLWFRDDDDFKAGMNYVALETAKSGVRVLAFILMSNHVHFLLECNKWESEEFITNIKRKYSLYYRRRYGIKEFLRRNGVDIREIPCKDEAPERAIAYVQMNSVAANICLSPTQYPWGTGNVFFSQTKVEGIRAECLSWKAQCRLLRSHEQLPDNYLIADGYVLPESYTERVFVERLYRTPSRMQYFLLNSSKAKVALSVAESHIPSFRDQSIMAAIPDLCQSLFHSSSVSELPTESKSFLLKELRRRFSADVEQLARVTGIVRAEVIRLLDVL